MPNKKTLATAGFDAIGNNGKGKRGPERVKTIYEQGQQNQLSQMSEICHLKTSKLSNFTNLWTSENWAGAFKYRTDTPENHVSIN